MPTNQKKKHHYVPVTYLNGFTDSGGKVYTWRKDAPDVALHTVPDEIGLENYYYSQPLPDGGRDNNTLEDYFSTIEDRWPQVVGSVGAQDVSPADFFHLMQFLTLQRVRVPCARDASELNLAEMIKASARQLDGEGLLPPKPAEHQDIIDNLNVSIDPHMSLHAMKDMASGFARILNACRFEALHNQTGIDFLTSDNPVAVIDPEVSETQMQPYQLRSGLRSIELLFPITSRLMLRGLAGARFSPSVSHAFLTSEQEAKRFNRLSARFGYRLVIANSNEFAPLAKKYALLSPVTRFEADRSATGTGSIGRESVWGPRPTKAKWRR